MQWAGMGLQFASGAASNATSYIRTREYVKATNQNLFNPAGLRLRVLKTKDMIKRVGYPEEKLQLPQITTEVDLDEVRGLKAKDAAAKLVSQSSLDDPTVRRVEAMKGYVLPLNTDVPAQTFPDNLLRKMGAAQASKSARKQGEKSSKKDIKQEKQKIKGARRIEKVESRGEGRLERLKSTQDQNAENLEKQLSLTDDRGAQERIQKEHDKEQRRLEKRIAKRSAKNERKLNKRLDRQAKRTGNIDEEASKKAHKIRWLVIMNLQDDEDMAQDTYPGDSDDARTDIKELPA